MDGVGFQWCGLFWDAQKRKDTDTDADADAGSITDTDSQSDEDSESDTYNVAFGLQASDDMHGVIKLSWYHNSTVDTFYVYRSNTSSGTFDEIGETENTVYEDSEIEGGNYYYKVRAWSAEKGYSNYSPAVVGARYKLDEPTDISATDGEYVDKIVITWSGFFRSGEIFHLPADGLWDRERIGRNNSAFL